MILNSKGLTSQQVIENRIKYGNNSVKSSGGEGVLKLFMMQFFNPIAIVLLFASVITLILREYTDSVAIVLVIFVNSLLGFYQEHKSKVTLKNLQNLIKPECFVIRDSKKLKVSYENIVVGDIVLLFPGDRVPADGVLLNASALSIDESILTGESQEIEKNVLGNTKDINNIPAVQKVYMGTVVTNGVGEYKVTKVGERTQFGKIASRLLVEKETLTPLQEKIKRFSFTLLILVGVLVVIILSLYTLRNYSFAEGLEVALIIAVSAIPEALLLSLTVSLSRSMYRLLSHKVLVRKLIVAETLGSITALCIDKTGTLTEGKMTIVDSVFKNKQEALLALNLNKSDINVVGTTILNWLKNIKADVSSNPEKITPFNSTNKYSLALLNGQVYIVGAPDLLLKKSDLKNGERTDLMKSIDKFSQKGFRLVGIAKGELNESSLEEYDPNKLQWLGYLTISDPVRSNVAKVLKETIESGIKVKVITGDYIETAKNVLLQLGIDLKKEQILSGEQFEELTSSQKTEAVKTTVLFYRISPDQKYDIVDILQKSGEVVGMMGDGINDSPALKKADVGIVVNNAAEISKQTADMVLIDSNFQSIIEAIKEGRGVLENIRKIITFLLTDSFAEVILILLSLIFNYPIPLTALQILYINMIADSLPDMALSFEKNKIKSIKSQVDQNLFPKKNISLILIIGIIANVVIFLAYTYLLNLKYNIDTIRSFIFLCLAIDSLIFVYPIKVLNSKLSWNELFDNKILNLSVLLGIFMICFAFVFEPLSKLLDLKELSMSLIILSMGLVFLKLLLIQLIKTFTNKLEIK